MVRGPIHSDGASAKLADSRLSTHTRAMIRQLLEPGESLADASTWADEHNREIRGSTYWHFVNVPIWASRYDPRDCRPQGCVVSKIAGFKLQKSNTAARQGSPCPSTTGSSMGVLFRRATGSPALTS
jgi:S1/P1 Nuclease